MGLALSAISFIWDGLSSVTAYRFRALEEAVSKDNGWQPAGFLKLSHGHRWFVLGYLLEDLVLQVF
ncbi:hypothetical protein U1Q18_032653 [Sarracenia purpurea var. burkii]